MIRTILVVALVVLFILPIMTSAVAPALEVGGVAHAAGVNGDDDAMSFWDWCVLWWTTHLGEWPW